MIRRVRAAVPAAGEVEVTAHDDAAVAGQDVEPDPDRDEGAWRIARKVAKDRVISTVDPETRHMRKSRSVYRDGFKAHVAVEPDTGIITGVDLTPANAGDGPSGAADFGPRCRGCPIRARCTSAIDGKTSGRSELAGRCAIIVGCWLERKFSGKGSWHRSGPATHGSSPPSSPTPRRRHEPEASVMPSGVAGTSWPRSCGWLGRAMASSGSASIELRPTSARGKPWLAGLAHHLAAMTSDVRIGEMVIIEPGIFIAHGGVVVDGYVEIGRGTALMPSVTIGLQDHPLLVGLRGPTIGRDARICTGAKVLGPITIGDGAFVGANAVVLDDVPSSTTAVGIPARVVAERTT